MIALIRRTMNDDVLVWRLYLASAWVTVSLVLVSLTALAWPDLTLLLQYDRSAVAAGQVWRVLTGHLTHWNLDHLFWDAVMFAVLGVMCERRGRTRYVICLSTAAALISAATWFVSPEMTLYRGLSGLDSAQFGLLAVLISQEQWRARRFGPLALISALSAGFAAKIAFELVTGSTIFVDSSAAFTPAPLAHIVGFAVGAALGFVNTTQFAATCQPNTAHTRSMSQFGAGKL